MTVHERIEEVVRTFFGDDTITLTEDMTAENVPGWDSLAHVNLMFSIEEAFGIRFSDEELADLASWLFSNHKVIELNAKYHRPPARWILKFKEHHVRFHLGSDAHSLDEIGNFSRISDLIALVQHEPRSGGTRANQDIR